MLLCRNWIQDFENMLFSIWFKWLLHCLYIHIHTHDILTHLRITENFTYSCLCKYSEKMLNKCEGETEKEKGVTRIHTFLTKQRPFAYACVCWFIHLVVCSLARPCYMRKRESDFFFWKNQVVNFIRTLSDSKSECVPFFSSRSSKQNLPFQPNQLLYIKINFRDNWITIMTYASCDEGVIKLNIFRGISTNTGCVCACVFHSNVFVFLIIHTPKLREHSELFLCTVNKSTDQ